MTQVTKNARAKKPSTPKGAAMTKATTARKTTKASTKKAAPARKAAPVEAERTSGTYTLLVNRKVITSGDTVKEVRRAAWKMAQEDGCEAVSPRAMGWEAGVSKFGKKTYEIIQGAAQGVQA